MVVGSSECVKRHSDEFACEGSGAFQTFDFKRFGVLNARPDTRAETRTYDIMEINLRKQLVGKSVLAEDEYFEFCQFVSCGHT